LVRSADVSFDTAFSYRIVRIYRNSANASFAFSGHAVVRER
jgi:hypothetical protein